MTMQTDAKENSENTYDRGPDWSVCGQVTHLSNGDRAALRRMYITPSYRSDGIVEKLLRRARVSLNPYDTKSFESWCLLAHTAAVISGTTGRFAYSEKRLLGRSLHLVGLTEMSILRLISARGPALADNVKRIARILARGKSDAIPTNLTTLRELSGPCPIVAEHARRQIARDFYAANDAAAKPDKGDAK